MPQILTKYASGALANSEAADATLDPKSAFRYFVDFIMEVKTPDGVKTMLVEIKPKKQCKEPVKKSRVTRSYISEVKTWMVNKAKWEAAHEAATSRGWEFRVLTEDDLFGKQK